MKIATHSSWNDRDIATLAAVPVDEYYKMFKEHSKDELSKLLSAALEFDRIGNATAPMREISKRAREALKRIGGESLLNARRVRKYGVVIEDPPAGDKTPE